MENYVVMLVIGLVFFIISFLSGCWYTKWKSGIKKEKDYDSVVRQFRKYERDDEYKQLKRKLSDEINGYNLGEQKAIIVRRLYEMKRQTKRAENRNVFLSCLILPAMILYIFTADKMVSEVDNGFIILGGLVFVMIYLCVVRCGASAGMRCFKAVCILEDILKETGDGAPQRKKETVNLNDINDLVNTLKPVKKEHSVSDIL